MSLKVLFFGELAEHAEQAFSTTSLNVDISDNITDLNALKNHLLLTAKDHSAFCDGLNKTGVLYAINQTINASTEISLSDGDEIAFMSPLSGG